MRFQMRRRGIVPLAFAVLLTVAAGLSLAEEHALVPTTTPKGAAMSSDLPNGCAAPDRAAAASKSETGGIHSHQQCRHKPGVGSRALTGHDMQEPAADGRGPN
jgi:hypothetical protein